MKKILLSTLGLLLAVILILIIKTLLYKAPLPYKNEIEQVEQVEVDHSVLQKAIQFATISHPEIIDTQAFRAYYNFLERAFPLVHREMEVENFNEFSRTYVWKGKNPELKPALFLAHMDVVPVQESNLDKWNFSPFSGEFQDGFIYGRGAIDDKSVMIGILEAAETLLERGIELERDIYFAFGHDEELGGELGGVVMANHFKKKNKHFEYIIDEGLVIVTEALPGIEQPIALIGLAEKGAMSLSLKVELENGGHSMMPPAETAVSILSKAIIKVQERREKVVYNECVKQMFANLGPEMKWPEKIVFANMWLFKSMVTKQLEGSPTSNALLKTTYAPTIIKGGVQDNVLPSQAEAVINVRIIPGETVESVLEFVSEVIDDDRVQLTSEALNQPRDPTFISPTDNFAYQSIRKSIKEVFGNVHVAPGLVIGGTDSRHYSEVSGAIYRFAPMILDNNELEGIHGVNERLSKDNFRLMVNFYRQLMINTCGSEH